MGDPKYQAQFYPPSNLEPILARCGESATPFEIELLKTELHNFDQACGDAALNDRVTWLELCAAAISAGRFWVDGPGEESGRRSAETYAEANYGAGNYLLASAGSSDGRSNRTIVLAAAEYPALAESRRIVREARDARLSFIEGWIAAHR